MKNLPIGIQTFSSLVEQGYLYIDKTKEINNLFLKGGKYYFLSRPRRFGKSLLVNTLKEIFSGNKELFKDLWIYNEIQWVKSPVIYLDFLGYEYDTRLKLIESIESLINRNAHDSGIVLKETGYANRFRELIIELAKAGDVVILVDEYDKPIINNIENLDIAKENRDILKTFYEVIKSTDQYIKFVFITGVSMFSKVSIFSGLNNLNDITVDKNFSSLLGYTHQELLHYFQDRIKNEQLENIRKWYNGYSWDGKNFVYNPLSILYFFNKGKFGNYWFTTGTPTFLLDLIKKRNKAISSFENIEVDEAIFESFDIENLGIISMLFQTGYLTIKAIKQIGVQIKYQLSFPNVEVQESFLKHFLSSYSTEETASVGGKILDLAEHVMNHEMDKFFAVIRALLASIPSHIFINDKEAYYHTIIYIILKLVGVNINVEVQTNHGRIDAVMETRDYIYVIEFKMGSSREAITQIKEKKYYERYKSSGKIIEIIGIGFDNKERNIKEYLVERIQPL